MSRRLPPVALSVIFFWYKPSLWCRADVRPWHFVIYFPYKPFMWCRSDARLWHACYLFFLISPLCGVAQTPDWSMLYIYHPCEASLQTLDQFILLLLSVAHFLFNMNDLLACIMNFILWLTKWSWIVLVHDYHLLYYTCFHDVCEYIQSTH